MGGEFKECHLWVEYKPLGGWWRDWVGIWWNRRMLIIKERGDLEEYADGRRICQMNDYDWSGFRISPRTKKFGSQIQSVVICYGVSLIGSVYFLTAGTWNQSCTQIRSPTSTMARFNVASHWLRSQSQTQSSSSEITHLTAVPTWRLSLSKRPQFSPTAFSGSANKDQMLNCYLIFPLRSDSWKRELGSLLAIHWI